METIQEISINNRLNIRLVKFNNSYYVFRSISNSFASECVYEGHTFVKAKNEFKNFVADAL